MNNLEKINYLRFKESSSEKIINRNGEWVREITTTKKGFDSVLSEWCKIDTVKKILPLEHQKKELLQTLYIRRTGYNEFLKPIEAYFKIIRVVEIINKKSSLFLVEACNRLFITNLRITAPLNFNYTPEGISIEILKEEKLSKEELNKLMADMNDKNPIKRPIIIEELPNGERRCLVA